MTYSKLETGERIRKQREFLGYSREKLAECIGRVPKYCADIERGQCGMSIETLLELSNVLNLSLDYIILGEKDEEEKLSPSELTSDIEIIQTLLKYCPKNKIEYAIELLKVYLQSCQKTVE